MKEKGKRCTMNNFDSELEAILSEFAGGPDVQAAEEAAPETPAKTVSKPIPAENADETTVFITDRTPDGERITHFAEKYKKKEPERKPEVKRDRPPAPSSKQKQGMPDMTRIMPVEKKAGKDKSAEIKEQTQAEKKAKKDAAAAAAKAEAEARELEKRRNREAREAKKAEKLALKEERMRQKLEKPPRTTFADVTPPWLIRIMGFLLTTILLVFILCCVSPASGSAAAAKTVARTADISASVNKFATEKARDAAISESPVQEEIVEQLAATQKTVHKIPEDATVAPEPLVSGFGKVSTANASEIMGIIQQARDYGLLGADERVVFSPDVEFNTGSYYQDIQYYLDSTLLVICWKEIINGNTCTFCEVKTQDASQLRRKLAGDMFGSDVLEYTTSMHKATNAVVSMNADFYRFRDMGVVVYNRQLYRFNEGDYLYRYGQMLKKYNCIDTMFVTGSGDFLFYHLYEESDPAAMQQFIDDNDILFSIAFGPVLVENGELNTSYFDEEWYPIGEINTGYSRAGIGQVDHLHYLYMSLNHSDEKAARWHTKEFAEHFYEKGVLNAYSLDGGQTSEIVFQGGEAYNHVDHVNGTSSRQVSDMIYFASAINGEEVTE